MFVEHPKSLYLNGDVNSDHVIVKNAEEEAQMREKGYRVHGEPEEKQEEKRKPGRPRKEQA